MNQSVEHIIRSLNTAMVALLGLAIADRASADDHDAVFAAVPSDSVIVAFQDTSIGPKSTVDQVGSGLGTDDARPLVDLGSISKFVTAVAVLTLVDEGRVSLDTRVHEVLGEDAGNLAEITVHQLLTHTSGVVESTGDDFERLTRDEFLDRLASEPLEYAPGTEHRYSNAGYSLLAAVIEVISQKSYESFLFADVLKDGAIARVGYTSVFNEDASIRSARSLATGFRRQTIAAASWGAEAPGWNLVGNGGLVTTAPDFLSFWSAFLKGKIVSEHLVEAALTPHVNEGDGDSFYGYGLVVQEHPKLGQMYWHDGGNDIFSAEWCHLVASDQAIFTAGLGEDAFDAMDAVLSQLS